MRTDLIKKYGAEYSKERNIQDLQGAFKDLMGFWATGESEHTMNTVRQEHSFNLNDFMVALLRHIAEERHTDGRIHPELRKVARQIWGYDD